VDADAELGVGGNLRAPEHVQNPAGDARDVVDALGARRALHEVRPDGGDERREPAGVFERADAAAHRGEDALPDADLAVGVVDAEVAVVVGERGHRLLVEVREHVAARR